MDSVKNMMEKVGMKGGSHQLPFSEYSTAGSAAHSAPVVKTGGRKRSCKGSRKRSRSRSRSKRGGGPADYKGGKRSKRSRRRSRK